MESSIDYILVTLGILLLIVVLFIKFGVSRKPDLLQPPSTPDNGTVQPPKKNNFQLALIVGILVFLLIDGISILIFFMVAEEEGNSDMSYEYSCSIDSDCDCSEWDAAGYFSCKCIDNQCVSIEP